MRWEVARSQTRTSVANTREHDAATRIEREPGVGDRRSHAVAGQALESVSIVGVDEAIAAKPLTNSEAVNLRQQS